ncbi:PEGA domain-containing protein [Archangium primigenium]|uniref:PEGA domain-containing protein n=1 Tax=[Archangium] primigenium TaxID=2792470 RepID=UPI00195B1E4E|nr:PEGA domain-containing protein [Archangium primigenium]MBM7115528.1 PEGA domain-containing protein [Archangium primigenium]
MSPPTSQGAPAVLRLASAVCAVVAAGLFVLRVTQGEARTASLEAEDDTPVQESRTAFQGALLSLESSPSGASVRVNGVDQGETPVTVGLDCVPGGAVRLEFTLRGFEKTTHETPCPRDALVTLKARLHKAAGARAGKR